MITAAPNPLPFTSGTGYHPVGCWREPGHHSCAIALLDRLAGDDNVGVVEVDDIECCGGADTLPSYVAWLAASVVMPDAPQPSLPLGVRR